MSDLIYNAEKVRSARDRLVRIIRLIFYREKLTFEDFDELHRRHITKFPKSQTQINSSLNNDRRLLKDDRISWDKFQYLIHDILRMNIKDFRLVVENPDTGVDMVISADDYVDTAGVYHEAPYVGASPANENKKV